MKKLLLPLIIMILFSCSKDADCNSEKLEIIKKYDNLILLAFDDVLQQKALIEEKQAALNNLDCGN